MPVFRYALLNCCFLICIGPLPSVPRLYEEFALAMTVVFVHFMSDQPAADRADRTADQRSARAVRRRAAHECACTAADHSAPFSVIQLVPSRTSGNA